jgi:hypothetical protein
MQEIATLRRFTRGPCVATMDRMQGMIRCGLLAGCLVACGGSDPAMPDGALPDTGGSDGGAGMHVVWETTPAMWPGNVDGGLQLDSADFFFDNLRVIGDASPGDFRTTKALFQLHWDATHMPETIDFDDAPTGVYSKVSFQIDGHLVESSYHFKGHVSVSGTSFPFEVEDRNSLSLSLQCNRTLAPGGSVTLGVMINFADALKSVDWSSVHMDNGTIELETSDSQMPAFRDKFSQAFSIDNSGPQ